MSIDVSRNKSAEASVITVVAHPSVRSRRGPTVKAQAGPGCCCCCCLHTIGGLIGAAVAPWVGNSPKPDTYLKAMQDWDEITERKVPSLPNADPPGRYSTPPLPTVPLPTSVGKQGITLPGHGFLNHPDVVPADASYQVEAATASMPASEAEQDVVLPENYFSAVGIFWVTTFILTVLGAFLWIRNNRIDDGENDSGYVLSLLLFLPAYQVAACVVTAIVLARSSRPDEVNQLRQLGKIFLGIIVGTGLGIFAMVLLARAFSDNGNWDPE